jgi:hypothetical protein
VAGLVAEIPHHVQLTFDFDRNLFLDATQSRIGEIEGDADQRRVIRASPLIAQIDRRTERQALRAKLVVQLRDEALDERPAKRQPERGDPLAEKRLSVVLPLFEWHTHSRRERKRHTQM